MFWFRLELATTKYNLGPLLERRRASPVGQASAGPLLNAAIDGSVRLAIRRTQTAAMRVFKLDTATGVCKQYFVFADVQDVGADNSIAEFAEDKQRRLVRVWRLGTPTRGLYVYNPLLNP